MSTVAELVANLGGAVLRVIAAPAGAAMRIARVVVADPGDPLEVGRGDLVIGIGVVPGLAADRLLAQLAGAGAAGLVTRESVARQLAGEAARLGVTLLGVPAGAQWAQVILLVSSVASRERFGTSDDRLLGTEGGDLFAIANVIAELVDAPITIEDPQSRVIAFSRRQEEADEVRRLTILGRRVPDRYQEAFRAAGLFQRLAREPAPIFIHDLVEGLSPRVAVAVRAGEELLGSIWAAVPEPLSPQREASLLEASHFVALHLLRRSLMDDGSRLECELLEAVLEGGRLAVEAAERLHLAGPPMAVVAAAPEADPELVESLLPRLRDLLSMHLSIERRVPATVVGSTVYSVLSLSPGAERMGGPQRATLQRLAERSRTVLRAPALIGVGSVVASPAAAADSRTHADEVIRVLRADGRPGVAEIGDVSSRVLLLKVSDALADDPDLLSRPIRLLQQHDLENNTGYLATLAAYLRAFGAADAAAQQLHVHANTVRYRLRQIQSLTGLLLTDPDERLALTIQLRLLTHSRRAAPAAAEPVSVRL